MIDEGIAPAATLPTPTAAPAEAERAALLTAVVTFGRFALESQRIATTIEQAVEIVTRTLGAPIGLVPMTGTSPTGLGVFEAPPRLFSDLESEFVAQVAHVLAAALERDHLETGLRTRARDLQQALLPTRSPVVVGIESAARYAPAGGEAVGGDWYDLLLLPNGHVALVMGDVEGHNAAAAAVMGQVRNVLRAYAADGHPPEQIMTKINRFVHQHIDRLVTCCYVELCPETRSAVSVSAGHAGPMLLTQAGGVREVPITGGLLFGVDGEQDYPATFSRLPPGGCLLLVTDGLVDDLPGAVHSNPRTFAVAAASRAGQSIETLADSLMRSPSTPPETQRDDAALLAVRLTACPA
jgi:serine phosphatase RsbU (regulator of sigma subunit)